MSQPRPEHAPILFFRPYPLSLVPLPLAGEAFGSWLELWLSLSQRRGPVTIVVPHGFELPRGYWLVPSPVQVTFCAPEDAP